MSLSLMRRLSTKKELLHIEKLLRSLFYTIDGATCHALMTMEYQIWRKRVLQHLLSLEKQDVAKQDLVKQDLVSESHTMTAYLSGYKIVYEQHMCAISRILPNVCFNKLTHSDSQPILEPLECKSIFKKQRVCPFQHQA